MLPSVVHRDLLERDAELATVLRFADAARDGSAGVLLIEGPAGVGKSSVLGVARERAGVPVLAARGSELERRVPFALARRLLAPVAAAAPAPGLARAVFEPSPHDGKIPSPDVLAAGLVEMLAGGRAPALLVVDDLQWADGPSLLFLAQLAARGDELPVSIALAVRSGEAPADQALLSRIEGLPRTTVLRPAPLTAKAVGVLLESALPGASEVSSEAVHRVTAGNPFLVREVVATISAGDDGELDRVLAATAAPDRVVRSVNARLARLAPEAQALAAAVTVLGSAPLRRAATLAGLAPRDAVVAADALAAADILEPDEPLRFVHALTAAAVMQGLAPFERGRLHRRAAELLRADGEWPELVASHLLRAPPAGDDRAVSVLLTAAGLTRERGEPGEAARLLVRALDEPPSPGRRAEVLVALGRNELATAAPDAGARFSAALAVARDPDVRVAAWHGLALAHMAHGRIAESAAAAAQGRAELEPGDPRDELLLTDELAASNWQPELQSRARALADEVVAGLGSGSGPADPRLAALLVSFLGLQGRSVEHIAPLARLATADDPLIHPDANAIALAGIATSLFAIDELELARSVVDAALERAQALGDTPMEVVAGASRAQILYLQGLLEPAEQELGDLLAGRLAGYEVFSAFTMTTLARVRLARGDVDAAAAAMRALEPFDPHQPGLRAEVGWLRLAQDRPREAVEEFLASGAFDEGVLGFDNPGVVAWRRGAASALLRLGDRDRAVELAGVEVDRAREIGARRPLALALSTFGTALGGDDGLAALAEAAALIEASPSKVWVAPVLLAHGAALRRAGRAREARLPLRRAAQLADAMGLVGVAAEARTELRVAGGRYRRRGERPDDALTASEERVARLAADGHSTPEIAQQLLLSRRTIDSHLAAVYRKLGINSRRQLAAVLPEPPARHDQARGRP